MLLLLVRRLGPLAAAITAFTLGHSLSLAAATLGWLIVPAPPVEASIALSIVVLAAELARPPGRGLRLTARHPRAVAAAFGLLHGLGFAGALREIVLPQEDAPLALLGFNVGVELGQLAFIAVVRTALRVLARLAPLPATTPRLAAYTTGTLAACWTIERLGAVLA